MAAGASTHPDHRLGNRLIRLGAWVLLILCASGTVGTSLIWRASVHRQESQAFRTASTDVADSMASAFRRDTDFAASLRAILSEQPDMTQARFERLLETDDAAQRYPAGVGTAFILNVPASDLAAVGARLLADPPATAIPATSFQVVPPGPRPSYCILRLGTSAGGPGTAPIGLDLCANPVPGVTSSSPVAGLELARDSGQSTVIVLDATPGVFGVIAPVYRDGTTPATIAQRRTDLLGWVAASFNGATVLADGGGGRPGLHVDIVHQNPQSAPLVLASTGRAKAGGSHRSVEVYADGRWQVRVSGQVVTGALSANAQFWLVLAVGLAFTGLLVAFVHVLVRSRGRALHMVERKTAELSHQALHDGLTGLPNRALILDRVEQALVRARRHGSDIAVMFLDLDGFKRINDTFGHGRGDQLLRAVATRLTGVLREADNVGRLGGDEFVILLDESTVHAGPELVAERIRSVLAEPFTLDQDLGLQVGVQVSIGIARGLRESAQDLLRDADVALYEAKASGKDRSVEFVADMQTAVQERWELEMDLREAVGTDQLFLVYQPTYDLRDVTVTGVEALLRWQHPTRGLVMPDVFIPVAEESGIIVPLGRWVLAEASRQGAEWHRKGFPLSISVNVSQRQLERGLDFVSDVRTALETSGLDPRSLMLEVSESLLMRDVAVSAHRLRLLKGLGVRIAIDDFGTRYSSLAHLELFPVDALKIDRSFISSISGNANSGPLIRTLIQLGKALGIETLAEGIEEEAQLDELQRERCDTGQGFLFARPLPVSALEELLRPFPMVGTSASPAPRSML